MSLSIATPAQLEQAASTFAQAPWLAVDTEFHAERRFIPKLYLLQVATPDGQIWLIDPEVDGSLEAVAEVLPSRPWIVHAGRQDLRVLARKLGRVSEEVFDVQIAAGLVSSDYPAPYARLTEHWLNVPVSKGHTLSDWSRRPLSEGQLAYAASDVQLLGQLAARLQQALREAGREELAVQACAEARQMALDGPSADDTWTHLLAAGTLTTEGQGVMSELAAWRLEVAQTNNQPINSVLSVGLMLELARRRPRSVSALYDNRRFPKGIAKRHGATLIACVEAGISRAPESIPRILPPRSSAARRFDFLRLASHTLAEKNNWGAELVLPDAVLRHLALYDAPVTDRLSPWRSVLCGTQLEDLKSGDLSIVIAGQDTRISPPPPFAPK